MNGVKHAVIGGLCLVLLSIVAVLHGITAVANGHKKYPMREAVSGD